MHPSFKKGHKGNLMSAEMQGSTQKCLRSVEAES